MTTQKSDIKPYQAVVVIAFFTIMFISILVLIDMRNSYKGASFLHYQNNALNILVDNTIYKFGDYHDHSEIPLQNYNIHALVGGFSYYPNEDILLRQGSRELGIIDSILVFLRGSGKLTSKDKEASLVRCQTSTMNNICNQAIQNETFERTYRSVILKDESVIIADTSNHRLAWFDPAGKLIQEVTNGFRFPNQIEVINDTLYVANTNRNAISMFSLENHALLSELEKWEHWSLKSGISSEKGHIYPTEFVKVEKGLAVLAHNNSLARGDIYLMDAQGEVIRAFERPLNADIISITPFRGEILAADYSNYKIYRFSQLGQLLGEFSPPNLSKVMHNQRIQYAMYDQYLLYLYIAAGIVFAIFFAMGAWLEWSRHKSKKQRSVFGDIKKLGDFPKPEFDHPDIKWLTHHTNKLMVNKFFLWSLNTIIFVCAVVAFFSIVSMGDNPLRLRMILMLMGTVVFYILIIWLSKNQKKPKLGILGQWILIQDEKGGRAIGGAEKLRYNGNLIIVDEVYIVLQNGHHPAFDKDEKEQFLDPLLAVAKKMPLLDVWKFLWQKRDKSLLSALVILPLFIVAFLLR